MDSFDQSLKYLVHKHPADFVQFALEDPSARVIKPLPAALPARRRDIDGCYLVACGDEQRVAHFEFHRRNQSLDDLATDVAEAQIRLYRREKRLVTSLVWDLYGRRDEPLFDERSLAFGKAIRRSSDAAYIRVNLRAIEWREFLQHAPPPLWPLVPLTMGGACEEAVVRARDVIQARTDLGFSDRADYLAILKFIAAAEDVPERLLDVALVEELFMGSEYWNSVVARGFAKGEVNGFAKGEMHGETKTLATSIIDILQRRLGSVKHHVRKQILAETNLETLRKWHDMAIDAIDANGAQRLVDAIRKSRSA